ncbi:MAG: AraC family transcriptional regulator [Demequina sp.]|uniref:AraC family transcriptional regulator n=1 Tax=Demequina sp. TaxID=2050685 RepID=UPI003A861773
MDERLARDTVWEEHAHAWGELAWNERGASTATLGARRFTITPAVGLWIPAGAPHSATARAGTWFRAAQFTGTPATFGAQPVAVDITPLLRLLLVRLDEELAPSSRALTEALILDVLSPSPRESEVRLPGSGLLEPIASAYARAPHDARTLADWADRLGVSTRTITRAFERETGMTFARWVAAVRAERAIAMLAAGEDTEDVASAVGYASVSAFGAAFRRVTGVTPGSYRPATE